MSLIVVSIVATFPFPSIYASACISTLPIFFFEPNIDLPVTNEPELKVEATATKILEEYFEMGLSRATPQNGFKKGLKVFKSDGYKATVKELRDNWIGRKCAIWRRAK